MPFRSDKQRRYMFKFHPDIAKRWTKEYGPKPVGNTQETAKRILRKRRRS